MPDFLTPLLVGFSILALLGVVFEEQTKVSKAEVTLFFGTLSWVLLFAFTDSGDARTAVNAELAENIGEIASLWLYLLATMTFVAYLNHKGMIEKLLYLLLPERIGERALLLATGVFCFFLSSLVDNITATLVSVALVLSLKLDRPKTLRFVTLVVFSINSGGAALITGDVTTLMIFLSGKLAITDFLLLTAPALGAVLLLGAFLSVGMEGQLAVEARAMPVRGVDVGIGVVFLLTIGATLAGNVFFQIPPVLTFLTGLSIMFLVSRFVDPEAMHDPILEYIRRIEFETLLFFLGILLIVGVLKELRVLDTVAGLYALMPVWAANYLVGLASSVVDNVPLTAAVLKSDIAMTQADWVGLTYTAGVGGSLLIVGSAAGIVAMSRVPGLTFASYLRYAWLSLLAFTAGYGAVVALARGLLG
ncbi:MAG: sodium:proton antiporter NhaD [Pseudomonadales bacterium]|jgi:Na+/H+ antiporter NhaD/arsenite permease-like protein